MIITVNFIGFVTIRRSFCDIYYGIIIMLLLFCDIVVISNIHNYDFDIIRKDINQLMTFKVG